MLLILLNLTFYMNLKKMFRINEIDSIFRAKWKFSCIQYTIKGCNIVNSIKFDET